MPWAHDSHGSVPLFVTPSGEPSEKELKDTELLKMLIHSYYAIVKRKVVDAVPKAIMHFMVNTCRERLQHECIEQLYQSDLFATLLQEAEDVRERLIRCRTRLSELERVQEMLTCIGDIPAPCHAVACT